MQKGKSAKICAGVGFHSLEVFCAKRKSVVQKSLLDFGTHPLGSVLCIKKRCSVKKEDSKGSSVA